MNDSMRARINIALDIQTELHWFTGQKPVIAGGAARDVYYGVVPKDFDLIFNQDVRPNDLSGFFAYHGISPRFIPMYKDVSSDRIRGVCKMNHKGIDFDLIFYSISHDETVTDYFDFNFNQFELQGHTAVFTGDTANWDAVYGGIRQLVQTRYDASEARVDYIRKKWRAYQTAHVINAKSRGV